MRKTTFPYSISLLTILFSLLGSHSPAASGQVISKRVISGNFTQVKGSTNRFYNLAVGAGRAAEGMRADWQRDLFTAHRECGFRYVRFHGLLHDEMGVYNEDKRGEPVYNFQYVDAVYDAILKIGMRPFVELAFMPDKLKSNDKTIFWWKGNISPPKDYARWQNLIKALVNHWKERYGEEEVKEWYFEVWNEPNLDFFFSGTQADYFKLYESTARAVKSVSAAFRVGGPATAGRGWIPETIDFAAKNNVPLDFLTTHDYGVKGIGFDDDGNQKLFLDTDPKAIIEGVRDLNAKIKASALPNLPLHYTEWSTSYSPRDPVHDSYVSAPYILSKLKGSEGFADSMSYWTFTDIFEENGTVSNPFHGGFGLINFQGLRKPAFYAYQFLNQLGSDELKNSDAASWITRSNHAIEVLLWNFDPPKTTESDQVTYKKLLPPQNLGPVEISISGVPPRSYKLRVFQVGFQVNDVYSDYLKMGAPPNLSREQVKELSDRSGGRPVEEANVEISADGLFSKTLKIRQNDVFLCILEKRR